MLYRLDIFQAHFFASKLSNKFSSFYNQVIFNSKYTLHKQIIKIKIYQFFILIAKVVNQQKNFKQKIIFIIILKQYQVKYVAIFYKVKKPIIAIKKKVIAYKVILNIFIYKVNKN